MMNFLNMLRKKPKALQLSEDDIQWKNAFETVLQEMVPGEVFNLVAVPEENGTTRFELHTESKRTMVAWAEIQAALLPGVSPENPS